MSNKHKKLPKVPAPLPPKLPLDLHIPRKALGEDYRDDPKDMKPEFLLNLAMELRARPCKTEAVFNRSKELEVEILRRLKLVRFEDNFS